MSPQSNPNGHDRTFADVADRLAEWQRREAAPDATLGALQRLLAEICAQRHGASPERRARWDAELIALATRFEHLAGGLSDLAADLTADDLAA